MGTAWAHAALYPWEHGYYVGGIETVKVDLMLRVFSNKWHVYAGLAILNPFACVQIGQFAQSVTDIFKLVLAADKEGPRTRMYDARQRVFGDIDAYKQATSPSQFDSRDGTPSGYYSPERTPVNSHLSLLAVVDSWAHLNIQPTVHLELAATPIFRMWFGVAGYLFLFKERLGNLIHAALHDTSHRYDDVEFVVASRGWSQCVLSGSFDLYRKGFEETADFFKPRFEEANKVGPKC
ncbi:unnamed protein product [Peniophora sp. CBMAI 1063]|nr:unnamed protein product [Peniophora sp. CBMAI 1063]